MHNMHRGTHASGRLWLSFQLVLTPCLRDLIRRMATSLKWRLTKNWIEEGLSAPLLANFPSVQQLDYSVEFPRFWLCWLPGELLPPRPPLDTSPLASPGRLRRLALRYAEVTDLAPLASLTSLHSLDISKNKVHHLHPLAALTQLQSLDCNDIWTEDLTPITALTALTSLNCGRNIVEYRTTTADHNGVGSDF